MVGAALRKPLDQHRARIGHGDIGMEPEAEGHRRVPGLAAVVDPRCDRQGGGLQPQLQAQAKWEGEMGPGGRAIAELHRHAAPIGQGLQAPGQVAGKTVLAHRIGAARQGKLITGKVAADRKQHRHAAPHRKGGIGEAFGIEIEDLPAVAAPPRQQAAPFGHEPELITAGGILEDPVGPGVFDRQQGHDGQAEALDRPYPHHPCRLLPGGAGWGHGGISVSGSPGAGLYGTLPRSAYRHGLMPEAMATA